MLLCRKNDAINDDHADDDVGDDDIGHNDHGDIVELLTLNHNHKNNHKYNHKKDEIFICNEHEFCLPSSILSI